MKLSRKFSKLGKKSAKAFKRKRWLAPVVVVFVAAGAMGALQLLGNAKAATLSLCGNLGTAPTIQHVIVVAMENKSYKQVVGSSNAPYQTSLANQCGNATAAFGATHTSAANYFATSAGEYPAASPPGCGSVSKCADASDNLYHQLDTAGLSWKSYQESMPSACDPTSVNNSYKIGHNPPIFYSDISSGECLANDVPVADLTAQSSAFWNDLQNQTLPSLSWVTPSESDDGEGSTNGATAEQMADTWLQNFLGTVQQSSSYQAGNTVVLVSYDEGSGSDYTTGEDCTNESLDMPVTNGVSAHQDSCHIPFFVVYPYTPAGMSDGTFFDHYSITKTVEDLFGLSYLAHAGDAQTNSLIGHFGLTAGASIAPPTTSCAATPLGMTELSDNLSLETSQTGWTGTYNSKSRPTRVQVAGGSYDGNWALQVAPKAGTSGIAGVNNANPLWVNNTVAGATYTGSAYVRASVPGEKISLVVHETTAAGSGVGNHTTTMTLGDTAWHQLSSAYKAKNSGDILHYTIYANNFADSTQYFQADCLSLQTPS